jgi:PAS domain-containing protein
MFENLMPREILGIKRDEIEGRNLRRLHNEELRDL